MSHSLADLNAHLFDALDRLSKPDLTAEQIQSEVDRAGAIVNVADQVTENAKVMLSAAKLYAEHGAHVLPHLPQIGKATE